MTIVVDLAAENAGGGGPGHDQKGQEDAGQGRALNREGQSDQGQGQRNPGAQGQKTDREGI